MPEIRTNRWTVLVVLCAGLLLVALDATVLHVAVPAIARDLEPSGVQLLWIVDAYPLACACLLILFGALGDRVGRRRVLLAGYAVFALASALAVLARDPVTLIAARALLGAGGAMIMPATLSLLRAVFPDRRERALAVGAWSAVAAAGAAAGPLAGGFLVERLPWGSVFLVNIPVLAVVLPLGRLVVPESRGRAEGPFDAAGALAAAGGLFALVLGVKRLGAGEAPLGPVTLSALCLGAALLALFVRRQRRSPRPLVDMGMFASRGFTAAVGCIVLAMLALTGLELIAVQYLQLVLGIDPFRAGLRLLPLTLAAVAAGLLGAPLLRVLGPRRMVSGGFLLTAAAVLLLARAGEHAGPLLLASGFVLLGAGLQTTLFGAYESLLGEAPPGSAGGAAAIGETSYQLGAGMGVALLGSVMNAVYRHSLASLHEVPRGASAAARRSLAEAYRAADALDGGPGQALRAAARHAYVHGLHVTLLVSAVLLLCGLPAALRLPRTTEDRGVGPVRREAATRTASGAPPVPGSRRAALRGSALDGRGSGP